MFSNGTCTGCWGSNYLCTACNFTGNDTVIFLIKNN